MFYLVAIFLVKFLKILTNYVFSNFKGLYCRIRAIDKNQKLVKLKSNLTYVFSKFRKSPFTTQEEGESLKISTPVFIFNMFANVIS